MATNFDFLENEPRFSAFADVAVSAEEIITIDPEASIINCRRAMEFAVKWMYSVDGSLTEPYDDSLQSMIDDRDFKDIVGEDIHRRMDYIRKTGNHVAHGSRRMGTDQALLCLENLFVFLDFVAVCYIRGYKGRDFDRKLVTDRIKEAAGARRETEQARELLKTRQEQLEKLTEQLDDRSLDLQELMQENASLKEKLSARRAEQQKTYVVKPLALSEYETRKLYIDDMLEEAGWTEGLDWINEYELPEEEDEEELLTADYALTGKDGSILAVIEALKTGYDVARGRTRAARVAEKVLKMQGTSPVIFLTNGFETHILDGIEPERKVSGIYSKTDLENLLSFRQNLPEEKAPAADEAITDRTYQKEAADAVLAAFCKENKRKALLVMAPLTGKTRTVAAVCSALLKAGWVKHILYLIEQEDAVLRAEEEFRQVTDHISYVNLCKKSPDRQAGIVFSTCHRMKECIDNAADSQGRIFTCGFFDLVITDDIYPDLYYRNRDLIRFFDARLLGMSAAPVAAVNPKLYDIFELPKGSPTFSYDMARAVKEGWQVGFKKAEMSVSMPEDEEKAEEWLYGRDNILAGIRDLMEKGLKTDKGEKIGKTLIFARDIRQGKLITEVFRKEYNRIWNQINLADPAAENVQKVLEGFAAPNGLPRILVSFGAYDTATDVPEITNLVFFCQARGKALFWQMLGRGARPCKGLDHGRDKTHFLVFDCCGNLERFRLQDTDSAETLSPEGEAFAAKAEMVFRLQEPAFAVKQEKGLREKLTAELLEEVRAFDRENFAVRQHLKYVEQYSVPENYETFTEETVTVFRSELAPLING